MARKLLGGAAGVLGVAAGLARHVAWYVSYQVDGRARTDDRRVGPESETQED